jgi:site-specific DNA-methyltransferase (cytosine-N4-specific)
MMVPRLQRELLQACIRWDPRIQTIYDPFVGSGTVLTEAMLLGRHFIGTDLNPLAILVCRAKADFLDADRLDMDLDSLLRAVHSDRSTRLAVKFANRDKWFAHHVAVGLSRLYRAISSRRLGGARRFWWVALAETVRLTSNSRTSTVKLHLRPAAELLSRPDPVIVFGDTARRNVRLMREQQQLLAEHQLLRDDRFVGELHLRVQDARAPVARVADMIVTSPPYGDNHTTVSYGQASYLPLQWIDRADIGYGTTDRCVMNTHRIDSDSLGGCRAGALLDVEPLLDRSSHLRRSFDALAAHPRDRRVRVAAFFRDLDDTLEPILDALRPRGLMMWTVGDRSVGGLRVPMASILRQLLGSRVEPVATLRREIPATRKRMAPRNTLSGTMRGETIMVLRKRA